MFRITKVDEARGRTRLRVEGSLSGSAVSALREAWREEAEARDQVVLDLSQVSYADSEGLTVLLVLRRCGVELSGCSPFVAAMLLHAQR